MGSKDDCSGYHLDVHSIDILGKSTSVLSHDISTRQIHVNGTLDSSFWSLVKILVFPLPTHLLLAIIWY
jgi:hypothetical protein